MAGLPFLKKTDNNKKIKQPVYIVHGFSQAHFRYKQVRFQIILSRSTASLQHPMYHDIKSNATQSFHHQQCILLKPARGQSYCATVSNRHKLLHSEDVRNHSNPSQKSRGKTIIHGHIKKTLKIMTATFQKLPLCTAVNKLNSNTGPAEFLL